MPTGGCFCGNIRVEYTGDPASVMLCHCTDCRKTSGATYSNNFIVPSANLKITKGTPKEISKIADSGKPITNCFCPDCGTTLFRYGESSGGIDGLRIIKAGILDDIDLLNSTKPVSECYAPSRLQWIAALDGASQFKAMPEA